MNTEKSIVRLSDEERQELQSIVKKLKGTSQKVNRAIALLHADANGPDYTRFKPEYCREIFRRWEFVDTPVHGSWLNIAENEFSSSYHWTLHLI
ncbi:MAG: hypothetical protein FWH27_08435 [Planctomycetaceae bacterium]|nr:hypothetical protein [Planctomycetaceae bacterium]